MAAKKNATRKNTSNPPVDNTTDSEAKKNIEDLMVLHAKQTKALAVMQKQDAEIEKAIKKAVGKDKELLGLFKKIKETNKIVGEAADDALEDGQVVDQFHSEVELFQQLVKTKKDKKTKDQLNKVLAIINRTGMSFKDFVDSLGQNLAHVSAELNDVHAELATLAGKELEAFENLVEASRNTKEGLEDVNKAFAKTLDSHETRLNSIKDAVNAIEQKTSKTNFFKSDPQKLFKDYQAILKQQEKEAVSFAISSGMDADSLNEIKAKFAVIQNGIDQGVLEAGKSMEGISEEEANEIKKQVSTLSKTSAVGLAGMQKDINEHKKLHEYQKQIMNLASGGIMGLVEEAGSVSRNIRSGVDDIKSLNFVSAYKSIKMAMDQAKSIRDAATKIQLGSTNSAVKGMAELAKGFGKIAIALTLFKLLLDLFLASRDQAANLNKTLFEAGGTVGMGFDLNAETSYGDMSDQLNDIRSEIYGNFSNAFDFAVTGQEVGEVIKELGHQGVMGTELREGGRNIRDSLKGVFTYARLLGKSDTEMASTMGSIATDLSLGMDEVESRFADLTSRWQGTSLSVDDFINSVKEISGEHAIFGDHMGEVSKLLEASGKNTMLSSKQALDATKVSSGLIDKMDVGKLRGLVSLTGPQEMMRLANDQAADLEKQISARRKKGDKDLGPLQFQLSSLNNIIKMYNEKGAANVDLAQILPKLSLGQQQSFLLKAASKTLNMTEEEVKGLRIEQVMEGTQIGNQMKAALGIGSEEYKALVNQAWSAGGGVDKTFAQAVSKLEAIKGSINDQTKQVDLNNKNAKTASQHLLTTEKATTIVMEQLFHQLYSQVRSIENFIMKIVEYFTKDHEKEKASDRVDTAFEGAGDEKVGSAAFLKIYQKTVEELDKMQSSGASQKDIDAKIAKMPSNLQGALKKTKETGSISHLLVDQDAKDLAKSDPKMAHLASQTSEVMKGSKALGKTLTGDQVHGSLNALGASSGMVDAMGKDNVTNNKELQAGMAAQVLSTGSGKGFSASVMDKQGNVVRPAYMSTGKNNSILSPLTGKVLASTGNTLWMSPNNHPDYALNIQSNGLEMFKKGQQIAMGQLLGKTSSSSDYPLAAYKSTVKGQVIGIADKNAVNSGKLTQISFGELMSGGGQFDLLKEQSVRQAKSGGYLQNKNSIRGNDDMSVDNTWNFLNDADQGMKRDWDSNVPWWMSSTAGDQMLKAAGFGEPVKHATGGVIPAGYPNDTYPALLSSGEEIISASETNYNSSRNTIIEFDDVKQSMRDQRSMMQAERAQRMRTGSAGIA